MRWQRIGALGVTVLAVATALPALAVIEATPDSSAATPTAQQAATGAEASRAYVRTVSRSRARVEPPPPSLSEVEGLAETIDPPLRLRTRWTTAELNVWSGPGERTKLLTVLDSGDKVEFTGTVHGAWAQIARHGDRLVWVRKTYLATEKPKPQSATATSSASVSGAPCPDGSAVESGLTSNAIAVYRSVCAAFPAVSSWGGRSGSGDHGAGLALDIMVSGSMGYAIADYVRAHAGELGVSYVIFAQRIWTVERSSEGWRYMADRGSTTANHYDHVHVSVF